MLCSFALRGPSVITPTSSLAEEVQADVLAVGNVGLSTIAGRLLGSVPANLSHRAKTDVLIVHTT